MRSIQEFLDFAKSNEQIWVKDKGCIVKDSIGIEDFSEFHVLIQRHMESSIFLKFSEMPCAFSANSTALGTYLDEKDIPQTFHLVTIPDFLKDILSAKSLSFNVYRRKWDEYTLLLEEVKLPLKVLEMKKVLEEYLGPLQVDFQLYQEPKVLCDRGKICVNNLFSKGNYYTIAYDESGEYDMSTDSWVW